MRNCVAVILFLLAPVVLQAQISGNWSDDFLKPGISEGNITGMVADENYLYIINNSWSGEFGGDPELRQFVRWDGEKYEHLGKMFKCTSCGLGYLETILMGNDNKIYIGGYFEGAYNNDGSFVESQNLIRWNITDEVWEPVSNGIEARRIISLEQNGNTLFVGGYNFYSVTQPDQSELPVFGVAELDLHTMTWSDMDGGVENSFYRDDYVYALELDGAGKLFVGGNINMYDLKEDSISFNSVIAWDIETENWVSVGGLSYTPFQGANPGPSTVQSLYYDEGSGKMFAGGGFSLNREVIGFAAYNGSVWNLIGGIGQPISGTFNVDQITKDPVNDLLYVTGSFNYDDASEPSVGNGIAIYDIYAESWVPDPLDSGITDSYTVSSSIAFFKDQLYVGGTFETAGDLYVNNLARWDGLRWDALGKGIHSNNSKINDAVKWNGKLIVGGDFDSFDAGMAKGLALYDPATKRWSELGGGLMQGSYPGMVYTLKLAGDILYVGGRFSQAGNTPAANLAHLDLQTMQWHAYGTGVEVVTYSNSQVQVRDIDIYNGYPAIAGFFERVDGVDVNHMALFDGTEWQALGDPGTSGVQSLFNDGDSALLVGGNFSSINGNDQLKGVAKYTDDGWSAVGGGVNGSVSAIARDPISGNLLVAGKAFRLWDEDGSYIEAAGMGSWTGERWFPFAAFEQSISSKQRFVNTLHIAEDSTIWLGGNFTHINGAEIQNLAFFDGCHFYPVGGGITGKATGGSTGTTEVNAITLLEDQLFVGGGFTRAGNNTSYGVASYSFDIQPIACETASLNRLESFYFCAPDSVSIGVQPGMYNFEWYNGSRNDSITVYTPGIYTLSGVTLTGLVIVDSLEVIFESPPVASLGNDTISYGPVSIPAPEGEGYNYSWSNGDSTRFSTIEETGTYSLTIYTRGGCTGSDSIGVIVYALDIYNGGSGSGYAQSEKINANAFDIYFGGQGDGYIASTYSNDNTFNIYSGGQGDGYISETFANPNTLDIYFGGQGDGYNAESFTNNKTFDIYFGGQGDGYNAEAFTNIKTFDIYSGGEGDGYVSEVYSNSKTFNIYSGGQGDGFASAEYLNPKIVSFVESMNKASKMLVYPNPVTNGPLHIKLPENAGEGRLDFIDAKGGMAYSEQILNTELINLELQSVLNRGLYIIRYRDERLKEVYTASVIVHY